MQPEKVLLGNMVSGDLDVSKNGKCLLQFCATNGLCIMNTFFEHKRIHKHTWYRDFLGQRSLIDFCIVWRICFLPCLMFVLKEGGVVNWSPPIVVCILKALKPLTKRKTFRPRNTYPVQWESLTDKEVRTAFADNIVSKFKELSASTEDIETEWCLFRTAVITSATNCCGRKRVGGTMSSEKWTPWCNQEVKEAIRVKKSGL